mgnify:CR=1 FL=1
MLQVDVFYLACRGHRYTTSKQQTVLMHTVKIKYVIIFTQIGYIKKTTHIVHFFKRMNMYVNIIFTKYYITAL